MLQGGLFSFFAQSAPENTSLSRHFLMANAALLSTSGTHGRAQRLRLPAKLHFPGPT